MNVAAGLIAERGLPQPLEIDSKDLTKKETTGIAKDQCLAHFEMKSRGKWRNC
jgi:hypothetical protein